jgi:uncharacterized protein YbjT (DUF2867 family)
MTRSPDGKPALPEGASYVTGDLENRNSVIRAMTEVDRVYLLTPLHPDETQLGRDAVWAAADARVDRVVFQSIHRAVEAMHVPHFASKVSIADELARSGVPYTIVAPNSFFQNDMGLLGPITQVGVYPLPVGPVGISHVDCDDIAAAAVKCLLGSGHEGKTYAVVGPAAHTGDQVAEIWAEALGRPVIYVGDNLDAFEHGALEMMPSWLASDLRTMFAHFIEHGWIATDAEIAELSTLLGRPSRSYENWVAEIAADWV